MRFKLIKEFMKWLEKYSALKLMHSYDFAEYEIDRLLKTEADGEIVFEDEDTFTAMYSYTFSIDSNYSTDSIPHTFVFDVKVIGIKGNVTTNDYEFEEFAELEYIIR